MIDGGGDGGTVAVGEKEMKVSESNIELHSSHQYIERARKKTPNEMRSDGFVRNKSGHYIS